MSVARELLLSLVAECQADPELTAKVRAVLGVQPAKAPESTVLFCRMKPFAAIIDVSERHAWDLHRRGLLVTIGSARTLRVDVRASLERMKQQPAQLDDAVERQARKAATLAARRATR